MPSRNLRRIALSAVAMPCFNVLPATAADELPAWAPKPPPTLVEDRFRVEVDLLGATFDTRLRIDESLDARGTDINAEDQLGLDEAQLLPQVEITLLPGDHHLLRLSGFATRRSAQAILDEQIVFEDDVYFVGERVDSQLNLTMIGLTYGYRFLVRDRSELAGTFGIQLAEVEANAVVRSRVVRDAESGVAPLPFAGIEGRFDFKQRWSAEGRLQYVAADIDEVEGAILDGRLAVTWRMNPYLVFGLGYRHLSIDVDSRNEGAPGRVDMTIDGPQLFMRASL